MTGKPSIITWMSRKPVGCRCPGCPHNLPAYRNSHKQYCCQRCQKRATYLRGYAAKMFANGVQIVDIALQLGASLATVERWLSTKDHNVNGVGDVRETKS